MNIIKKQYKKAIQINPNYALAYYSLGNANYEEKQYELSIINYTKVIELEAEYLFDITYFNRAAAYYFAGNYYKENNCIEMAQRYFNNALKDSKISGNFNLKKLLLNELEKISSDSSCINSHLKTIMEKKEIKNEKRISVGLERYVLLKAAGKSFHMGSENSSAYEKPVHIVKFTYDYFIGKTEVTQKEYREIMGVNPSDFKGDNYPVTDITWSDAVLFCNKKSKRENLDTIYSYESITGKQGDGCLLNNVKTDFDKSGYRLPTEAEWEFACRVGSEISVKEGDSIFTDKKNKNQPSLLELPIERISEVGYFPPNALGLFEMYANVLEWCTDWYGEKYYDECKKKGIVENPQGPKIGSKRVLRGGCWYFGTMDNLSTTRHWASPPFLPTRASFIGFRIVKRSE